MKRNGHRPWIFFLFVLGVVLFWNSLNTPFLWDEDLLIVNDPRVHHWSRLKDIFLKPFLSGSPGFDIYYRPLITLSFRVDHLFWGLNPLGYHLTNLFFHLANALLVYALFHYFFKNPPLSFWGAFLFLSHPAHVEAVTYIPGRVDLIPFFFVLLSFHFYLTGLESGKKFWLYFLSLFSYGLALLSKEMATFFLLMILAHMFFVEQKKAKLLGSEGALFLGMCLILGAWIFFRQFVSIRVPLATVLDLPRLPLRFSFLPEILFSYARVWIFPWPLYIGRVLQTETFALGRFVFEWLIFSLFLVGVVLFLKKKKERFWLLWIVVTFLPALQIVPLYWMNRNRLFLAEHFLYFPSVGIIGILLSRWGRHLLFAEEGKGGKKGVVFVLGLVFVFFSFLVIWRNGEYRDRITFFEKNVERAPWHFDSDINLGIAYQRIGRLKEAEEAFQKAISLQPNHALSHLNLGVISSRKGDLEKALGYYQKALEFLPRGTVDASIALYNMGSVYLNRGEWKKAMQFFDASIQNHPDANLLSYSEKSYAHWKLGEEEKALEVVKEGLERDPTHLKLRKIKAWLEIRLGSVPEAKKEKEGWERR